LTVHPDVARELLKTFHLEDDPVAFRSN